MSGKASKNTKTTESKPTKKVVKEESESEPDVESDVESEESDVESSDSEEETEKKPKEKKIKESFEDLLSGITASLTEMKDYEKQISEMEKQLKELYKNKNKIEHSIFARIKLLSKAHGDDINKAKKEKPKRKGNVNGGFNKEVPVPPILAKFLGMADGTCMARPKVMSALNNKFTELKLKDGQNTTIDKSTAKALGLGKEGEGRVIKFTEFQSFLASFYPKKED